MRTQSLIEDIKYIRVARGFLTVVLEKIQSHSTQPFRPHVPTEACSPEIHAIMARCWHETPEERPTVNELMADMKKICK